MRSQLSSGAGGADPYRGALQAPNVRISKPSRDRAPAFALLFVLCWSLLRFVLSEGSGFDLERVLAALFALGAAVLLLNEESLR
jgi:hypothetical protein